MKHIVFCVFKVNAFWVFVGWWLFFLNFTCYYCVCTHDRGEGQAVAWVWRSKENAVKLILSFHNYLGSGGGGAVTLGFSS